MASSNGSNRNNLPEWMAQELGFILRASRYIEAGLRDETVSVHGSETTQGQDENQPTTRSQDDNGQTNSNQQRQGSRQPIPQEDHRNTETRELPEPRVPDGDPLEVLRTNLPSVIWNIADLLNNRGVNARDPEPSQEQNGSVDREMTTFPTDNRSGSPAPSLYPTAVEMCTDSFKYRSLSNASTESEQECSICLMEIEDGEIARRLRCKHIFHRDCVDMWFVGHRTCPLCRSDVEGPPL